MMSPPDLACLYDQHAQALFAFLLDFTGREADARDILQEIFVRLARGDIRWPDVKCERGFLIRIAHNLAVDLIRRRDTRTRNHELFTQERVASIEGAADPDARTFQIALEKAIAELPLEQRAVLHLKTWSGLTFEEIAEALEISPNTAASRYRYGIDKLRVLLRPLYKEIQ